MTSGKSADEPLSKYPGRREIEDWFDAHLARAGKLADFETMTPQNLYQLMAMHIGWYWNSEDVGKLPHPTTGEPSTFTALYAFLDSLIKSRKARR